MSVSDVALGITAIATTTAAIVGILHYRRQWRREVYLEIVSERGSYHIHVRPELRPEFKDIERCKVYVDETLLLGKNSGDTEQLIQAGGGANWALPDLQLKGGKTVTVTDGRRSRFGRLLFRREKIRYEGVVKNQKLSDVRGYEDKS